MALPINILDELVKCGVPGEVIVAVAKLIADAEHIEAYRMRARERMRAVRARSRTHANTHEQQPAFSLDLPSKQNIEGRKKNKTPHKTLFPDPWPWPVRLEDQAEFQNFKKHALENVRRSARWDMTWERWQASPYRNAGRGNGKHETLTDQITRLADACREREQELGGGLFGTAHDVAGR